MDKALIYILFGWWGIIVCAIIGIVVCVGFCFSIYAFGKSFTYTNKEIGQTIKGFLGYDFGEEYTVLLNETRVHGDRPAHFLIKIPKNAMEGVEDFCNNLQTGECSYEGYEKTVEYKCDEYVERRESLIVNYRECTIDFRGVSF